MSTKYIGIGELAVTNKPGEVIKTMALGSCVGVVVVSAVPKAVGMIHVALPESSIDGNKAQNLPGYFADTGIKEIFKQLQKFGVNGKKNNLTIKIVGGANFMDKNDMFNIGKRNVLSIKKNLWRFGLAPRGEDVGGTISRTIWVEADSGKLFVSSPGRGQWEL
jgi:chemotaxis protein CheD